MHGVLAAGHTFRSPGSVYVTHIGANPVVSLLARIRAIVDGGCLSSAARRFTITSWTAGFRRVSGKRPRFYGSVF